MSVGIKERPQGKCWRFLHTPGSIPAASTNTDERTSLVEVFLYLQGECRRFLHTQGSIPAAPTSTDRKATSSAGGFFVSVGIKERPQGECRRFLHTPGSIHAASTNTDERTSPRGGCRHQIQAERECRHVHAPSQALSSSDSASARHHTGLRLCGNAKICKISLYFPSSGAYRWTAFLFTAHWAQGAPTNM